MKNIIYTKLFTEIRKHAEEKKIVKLQEKMRELERQMHGKYVYNNLWLY